MFSIVTVRNSDVTDTPVVLGKIMARKWEEIAERKKAVPQAELEQQAQQQRPTRGFVQAIAERVENGRPAVIAEIKKASPSKGVIRADFVPAELARSYEQGGAACLSVLTDVDFFQGADAYLKEAREAVNLPVIRKDFMVDEYQVYEARAMGADCILLIVAALEPAKLHALNALALELGLDVLVEVHNLQELEFARGLSNNLRGLNTRHLRALDGSRNTADDLWPPIGSAGIVITESGLLSPVDVQAMRVRDVHGFLVGE